MNKESLIKAIEQAESNGEYEKASELSRELLDY